MPDRSQAPHIKDAIEYAIALKKPEIFTLDNGVQVYNVNAGTEEVVQIEWVFKAGNWFEKSNNIASLLSDASQTFKGKAQIEKYSLSNSSLWVFFH